jgi:hypothetical protein
MPELLTESFCERCGTRYTFESAAPRGPRLKGLKVASRGLRNFVMSDDTSMDEAMAAARNEADRELTTHQLEAFHKTFNFCMECRQYTCANCWNEGEGRCLSCAPLFGMEPAAFGNVAAGGAVTVSGSEAIELHERNGHDGQAAPEPMAWPTSDLMRQAEAAAEPPPVEVAEPPVAAEAEAPPLPFEADVPLAPIEAAAPPPVPFEAEAPPLAFETEAPAPAFEAEAATEAPYSDDLSTLADDIEPIDFAARLAAVSGPAAAVAGPAVDPVPEVAAPEAIAFDAPVEPSAPISTEPVAPEPVEAATPVEPVEAAAPLEPVEPPVPIRSAPPVEAVAPPAPTATPEPVVPVEAVPEEVDDRAAAAAANTSDLLQRFRPGESLDDEIEAYERSHTDAPAAASAPETAPEPPVAPAAAESTPEPVAPAAADPVAPVAAPIAAIAAAPEPVIPVAAEPEPIIPAAAELEPVTPVAAAHVPVDLYPETEPEPVEAFAPPAPIEPAAEPEPVVPPVDLPAWLQPTPILEPVAAEPEIVAAEPEPEPEPVAAAPEPEPAPVAPPPRVDVVPQPTWQIVAPDTTPVVEPPVAPHQEPSQPPADAVAANAEPQWPAQPEWPTREPAAGLPFLNRPPAVTGGIEALWAASAQEVTQVGQATTTRPNTGVQPCVSCGLSLSANARFCRRCGTRQG